MNAYDVLMDKYRAEQRFRREVQEELEQLKLKQKKEKPKEFCQNYGRCNCTDGWNCR